MAKQFGNIWRTWGPRTPTALLALMIMAGCAGRPQMTDLWKDPSFTSVPIHNVFVVALRKDPVHRRMWEDAYAQELSARGVTATSSYQLFQEVPPDTQEVIEAIRKNGYDAVLVSIRLPNETTSTYLPGTMRRQSVTRQDYFGVFHTYWIDVLDPGHTETDEIRRVQTDIWATGGSGRLIWSGTLNTLDLASNLTVGTAVSKDIFPVLEAQGLIPKKTN
jgi:hypothetical protein